MLSLNTNIYASESMDSNEYSIIETFSDGSPASNWKLSEKKAYTSGSSAKATASFKQYKKDVYLQTITRTVTLSCNKSGKLY